MITTPTVSSLVAFLDGPERETRERVRAVLADPEAAPVPGLDIETHRRRVTDQLRLLASEGLGGLAFPKSAGGADDRAGYLAAVETLGHGDLSLMVAFGVQFGLFAGSIVGLGSDGHHDRFLSEAGRFALPGCFAMTETDHGSNVAALQTVARYDPDDDALIVETPHPGAAKDYIGGALVARSAVVFARLLVDGEDHGLHPLVVDLRDEHGRLLPGRLIEDCGPKAGLHGVGIGRITFTSVRIPRESLLDRFGGVDPDGKYTSPLETPGERFAAMLGTLLPARVAVAGAALAATKTALCIAIRYGERRRQFAAGDRPEQPILDYRTHQRRLLPAVAAAYGLHFALRHAGREAAAAFDEGRTGDDRRRIDAVVASLKATATWQAVDTVQVCREACGGRGYLADMRLGPLRADVDVFATFEGDNTVLLQLAARSLLTDFRREFEAASGQVLVRHLSRPVAARAATVRGPRRVDDIHFQLGALRWRERQMLAELGRRIQRRTRRGGPLDEAFLTNQNLAVDAARAHADRVVLETFCDAIEKSPADTRSLLTALCRLHGLVTLQASAAWLLERHYLSPAAARALRPTIEALCDELRPHAGLLVDAFAVPEAALGAMAVDR